MSQVIAFPGRNGRPEPPADAQHCRVVVVGGGFSGVLVAVHLLWRCRPGERVYLVERRPVIGQGLAYATPNPGHLLNVRAEKMSAFDDEPDHFSRWLAERSPDELKTGTRTTAAGTFVSRGLYGVYVQDLLRDAITRLGGAPHLYLVPDQAEALRPAGGALDLHTASGRAYRADAAVLALGHFPPDAAGKPGYFGNPWAPEALQNLDPTRPVLLVGTGLTMVDLHLGLRSSGFDGPIIALSRRGLLPQVHRPVTGWELRLDADDRRSLVTLTRGVRREVRRAAAAGADWRAVMDALRPHTRLLWQELRPDDKHRFLRHLRPWWESHRHRLAPTVAETVAAARQDGGLSIVTGRIERIEPEGEEVAVTWRPRGGGAARTMRVQRVINCSGPGTDLGQVADPLVSQILKDGLARPDAYRLGLDVTSHGALIDRQGAASPLLFAVGPLTRGAFWEITSVGDIRVQAEATAIAALDAARRATAA